MPKPNFKLNRLSKGFARIGKHAKTNKTKIGLDTKGKFYDGPETKTKSIPIYNHQLKSIVPNKVREMELRLRKKILEIQISNAELKSDNRSLKKAQDKLEQLRLATLKLKRKMLQSKIEKVKKLFGHDRRFVENVTNEIKALEKEIKIIRNANKNKK